MTDSECRTFPVISPDIWSGGGILDAKEEDIESTAVTTDDDATVTPPPIQS